MLHSIRSFVKMPGRHGQEGLTVIEIVIAVSIAAVALTGAYGLMIAAGNHFRSSATATDMYASSRLTMDRIFRDISETSNETVKVVTTNYESESGHRDDAISFASARDVNGEFQLGSYGAFNFTRPVWQKAIVYYLLNDYEQSGTSEDVSRCKNLYRKEVYTHNWEGGNFDPTVVMDTEGEVITGNVEYMHFGTPIAADPEITRQDHVLEVSLGFLMKEKDTKAGARRTIELTTAVPMMNRQR